MLKQFFSSLLILTCLLLQPVAFSQDNQNPNFPAEDFIQINPTIPNDALDFKDDSRESCCAKDYPGYTGEVETQTQVKEAASPALNVNPISEKKAKKEDPTFLVECNQYGKMTELVANDTMVPDIHKIHVKNPQTIYSFGQYVATTPNAGFSNEPNPDKQYMARNFHIATTGGDSTVALRDVQNYSLCMARGGNVMAVNNTHHGSLISYGGNDHVYLSGNNTDMLTRTGAGQDVIEVSQAKALPAGGSAFRGENWQASTIYKTALSGGTGDDTVVINNTPSGTKWCFIGGYTLFGEYFYVIELALPPSVTEGPRRQRINIGETVEHVVYKGRKYSLQEFLFHGSPVDEVARSVPVNAPLPASAVPSAYPHD